MHKLIYPDEEISGTAEVPARTPKPSLKSVIAPEKRPRPGSIKTAAFEANGEKHTVDVNIDSYSTRVIREHGKACKKAEAIADEDEQEDALFSIGVGFTLIGAVKTDAPIVLSEDGLLDANFNVAMALIAAVQETVFPSSSD